MVEGLKHHLKVYKLRSKVKIKDTTSAYDVLVAGVHDPWKGSSKTGEGVVASPGNLLSRFADPRCDNLGVRLLRPKDDAGAEVAFNYVPRPPLCCLDLWCEIIRFYVD